MPRSATANRSTCSRSVAARPSRGPSDSGALALDDLAQALTFATRTAGHAVLGGDTARPRAQLAALLRARRRVGLTTPHAAGPP